MLFDLHEKTHDQTMAMFQKQERTINQMQTQQFVEYGVKEIINDCLYPKEETLSLHIKKHLAVMAPEKMQKYE
ncbi:uncharacterized protein OCT59_004938 [Rhizophagus irregularis]|uniref:uncharacterized protein n=1 Tax=Rhizophagus irregularis TaxID=588596 RepID=UPI00332AAD71|nr:hypothetical protein OCT59_004938 [Rhizophagus irregularis]